MNRIEADLVVARKDRRERRGDAVQLDDAGSLSGRLCHREGKYGTAPRRNVESEGFVERAAHIRREGEHQPVAAFEIIQVLALDPHLDASAFVAHPGLFRDDGDIPTVARDVGKELRGAAHRRNLQALGVDGRELRVSVFPDEQGEGERLIRRDLGWGLDLEPAEARREHDENTVVGERLTGAARAARIVEARPQAVVVGNGEDLARFAGKYDELFGECRRRVQVIAFVVDEPNRPAKRAVGIQDEHLAFARANVDVSVAVDRG